MINFKKEFYKRFVRMEDYLEDTSEFKEAISALLAENINLDKEIQVKKGRITELAIECNDLCGEYNKKFIDLQQEKRRHGTTKIYYSVCIAVQAACFVVLVGIIKGWW